MHVKIAVSATKFLTIELGSASSQHVGGSFPKELTQVNPD